MSSYEVPQPDIEAARHAVILVGSHKVVGLSESLINVFLASYEKESGQPAAEYTPTYVPSVTHETLAAAHEAASTSTLVQRIGRAIDFLAYSPEGLEGPAIADELRTRALGRLVNMQLVVDAVDPDYSAAESFVTFGDLNYALTREALMSGTDSMDPNVEMAHQTETLKVETLVAEAYAVAALEQ
jgi:hypothetical protein